MPRASSASMKEADKDAVLLVHVPLFWLFCAEHSWNDLDLV